MSWPVLVCFAYPGYFISNSGYSAQGNEFSYHMLFGADFALNGTNMINEYTLHPWIHSFSHHRSTVDLLRQVSVPDVAPSTVLTRDNSLLSMAAGEFVECYNIEESRGE